MCSFSLCFPPGSVWSEELKEGNEFGKCRLDVRGQRVAVQVVYCLNIVTLTSVSQSFKSLQEASPSSVERTRVSN